MCWRSGHPVDPVVPSYFISSYGVRRQGSLNAHQSLCYCTVNDAPDVERRIPPILKYQARCNSISMSIINKPGNAIRVGFVGGSPTGFDGPPYCLPKILVGGVGFYPPTHTNQWNIKQIYILSPTKHTNLQVGEGRKRVVENSDPPLVFGQIQPWMQCMNFLGRQIEAIAPALSSALCDVCKIFTSSLCPIPPI